MLDTASLVLYVFSRGERDRRELQVGNRKRILDAIASLTCTQNGTLQKIQFDDRQKVYRVTNLRPGAYILSVATAGFQAEQRVIEIEGGEQTEVVILGLDGMPAYYQGRVRIPFVEHKELIGVSVGANDAKQWAKLYEALRVCQCTNDVAHETVPRSGILPLTLLPGTTPEQAIDLIRESLLDRCPSLLVGQVLEIDDLSARQLFEAASDVAQSKLAPREQLVPVLEASSNHVASFLTGDIVLKLKHDGLLNTIAPVLERFSLKYLRKLAFARGGYHFRAPRGTYGLLQACEELLRTGAVAYAEPAIASTSRDHSIRPTDLLFPRQWQLRKAGVPSAWQKLHRLTRGADPEAPDLTFGSEDIVVAVMDRGIPSKTENGRVVATHPEFSGCLPSGAPKILQFFDFERMAPNNDELPMRPKGELNDHGIACAGIVGALPNNDMDQSGVAEGIAGVAGHCPLVSVIRPQGRPDIEYADAYMWLAGFDPRESGGGVRPDFPSKLPRGADIVTNSFLEAGGRPISGTMQDCFDYLTTHGRNGKGVLLFFSVGNNEIDFDPISCPWASYGKTIAVAASAPNDTHPDYSNFGLGIDVCVPSVGFDNSKKYEVITTWLPGRGCICGNATHGQKDYSKFGLTSAAAPLAAGIAALMLSACPSLRWSEVRKIMRDTARKIDVNVEGAGRWEDTDGDGKLDYSAYYGFGRVQAGKALSRAIRVRQTLSR